MDEPLAPAATLEWHVIDDDTDDRLAVAGRHRARTLLQLRRPLPVPAALRPDTPPPPMRAFQRGRDDRDLLAVNNAAFSWHPDQGGWSPERLEAALSEEWVDDAGILVHEGDDGHLDGFCWTRVHPATDDEGPLGEIFAIGAHPRRHGTGLGTALVLAGLDHLGDRGLDTAILYVEDRNAAALHLYDRLGFTVHERRGGYR